MPNILSQLRATLQHHVLGRGRRVPIYIFCHHKIATVLMIKVFTDICASYGWKQKVVLGRRPIPDDADVVIFGHSLLDVDEIDRPFVGVHFVRDPRDVIVLGYLYHRRTTEKWCVNEDFSVSGQILSLQVPFALEYLPEPWMQGYLRSLEGKSYQRHLLEMDRTQGLLFEMSHYGAWTIQRMREWNYKHPAILELKFEDLMANFDNVMLSMLRHLQLKPRQLKRALSLAQRLDLRRKSTAEISRMSHVSSASTTRWQQYFEDIHKERFRVSFGNILSDLGYETSSQW